MLGISQVSHTICMVLGSGVAHSLHGVRVRHCTIHLAFTVSRTCGDSVVVTPPKH